MARLLLPRPDCKVIRRSRTNLSGAGRWHFVKEGRERVANCGTFISCLYDIDTSTLEKIKAADLCESCWRFEKDDIAIEQLSLFETVSTLKL